MMLARNNRLKSKNLGLVVTAMLAMMLLVFLVGCSKKEDMTESQEPAAVTATEAEPQAAVSLDKQALQEKVDRFNQLKQELKTIQDAAMANNPELTAQQQELEALIKETMEKKLADSGVDIERIKQLQTDLQNPDVADTEKMAMSTEFREKAQAYQMAQQATLSDPAITEKSNKFRTDLEAAMKNENEACGDMMVELQTLLGEFQQMQIQQAMAQSQAAAAAETAAGTQADASAAPAPTAEDQEASAAPATDMSAAAPAEAPAAE